MTNPLMFNSQDANVLVPVEPESELKTQELEDGKFVTVSQPIEKQYPPSSYHDCDIQVIIDAGLFDKLALGKPVQITLLDKQDQIMSGAEFIQELHLEDQVQKRSEELQKQFVEQFEQQHQQQQQQQQQVEPAKQIFNN